MTISAILFSILTIGFREEMFWVSYIGTLGKLAMDPGSRIFDGSNLFFATFVEGHLVTISVKLFSSLTNGFKGDVYSLRRYIPGTCQATWRPCVWRIKFVFAILKRSIQWSFLPNYFEFWPPDSEKIFEVYVLAISHDPWWSCCLNDRITFSCFL